MNDIATIHVDLRHLKHTALVVFLTGIAFNALVAITVILGGVGGESEWQILGTSLLVTAASIGVIANAAGLERGALGVTPVASATTLVGGLGLAMYAIWAHVDATVFYEWMGTLLVFGVAGTYASLISLPPLRPGHRWLQWAAYALAGGLAATATDAIWRADSVPLELLGVLGVLVAAATIVIPVLARVQPTATAAMPTARIAYCPVCGAGVSPSVEPVQTCDRCHTVFRAEVLSLEGRGMPDIGANID